MIQDLDIGFIYFEFKGLQISKSNARRLLYILASLLRKEKVILLALAVNSSFTFQTDF